MTLRGKLSCGRRAKVLSHVDDGVRTIVFQPVRAIRVASQHHQFIRLAGEDADQVARLHLPHGGRHGQPQDRRRARQHAVAQALATAAVDKHVRQLAHHVVAGRIQAVRRQGRRIQNDDHARRTGRLQAVQQRNERPQHLERARIRRVRPHGVLRVVDVHGPLVENLARPRHFRHFDEHQLARLAGIGLGIRRQVGDASRNAGAKYLETLPS